MFYHISEVPWQCWISQNSYLWHLTFWEGIIYLGSLMLKYILMQWILELWWRRKSSIPVGSRKSVDFSSPSSPWRFKKWVSYSKGPFYSILWSDLKWRYDHQKIVTLLKARYDWMHLRLQDFKTVSENNSVLFKISAQLKLCGGKAQNKTC